jgi:multidrug efflux pump subunit AcrA (membrane-fusion protein)
LLILVVALVVLAGQGRAADEPTATHPALDRLRKLKPEQRLREVEKLGGRAGTVVAVTRADLDLTLVERGSVESADVADVVCPSGLGSKATRTIKWVIEDGSQVKKGARLVELDAASLREQLGRQTVAIAQAKTTLGVADRHLALVRKKNELDVCTARLNLKVAQLELKKYTGKDADEKEVLELKVEQADLALGVVRLESNARQSHSQDEVKARAAALAQEEKRKKEIEAGIAACVITAPQDGMVVYHIPEQTRWAAPGGPRVLAQGEPVQEGQKLLRICGLERFTLHTRAPEARIRSVRAGQTAFIRVDAMPLHLLGAKVKSVSPVAAQQDWLRSNVKVYPVVVEITDKLPGLKPGMSAEVRIELERRVKVLLVPVEAVLKSGKDTFCYVKVGKGLQERKVTTGARNEQYVEVKEGLKDGEVVWRPPATPAGPAKAPVRGR